MKTVNSTALTLQYGVNELELLLTSEKLNELHIAKCEGAASHEVDCIPCRCGGRLISAGQRWAVRQVLLLALPSTATTASSGMCARQSS